jgi:hypothetical protein
MSKTSITVAMSGGVVPVPKTVSPSAATASGLVKVPAYVGTPLIEPDQYGGVIAVQAGTGHFTVAKANGRWLVVTPEGNGMWVFGVWGPFTDAHNDDQGSNYNARCMTKYGDIDLTWGPQQNRRLKAWGFNCMEQQIEWCSAWQTSPSWPSDHTQPVKIPGIPFRIGGAGYSLTNVFGYATNPVKELYWALGSNYTDYRGSFPDIFDPSFAEWIEGRLADTEFQNYASHPWVLGLSYDDTDWLYGFGASADWPEYGGSTHLGWVVLAGPPTQAHNWNSSITYSDTKVYIKQALADDLQTKYGTISALNSAWGSNYTTFGSSGGWPSGTGLLDEDGTASWIGSNWYTLAGADAEVKIDLDNFLYKISLKYHTVYGDLCASYAPNKMKLSTSTLGSWDVPPRKEILQGAAGRVDLVRTTLSTTSFQDKINFFYQYMGGIPILLWFGKTANPDSGLYRYSHDGVATQALRATWYEDGIDAYFATQNSGGVKPIAGIQFWSTLDHWVEKANWGLTSLCDNAYDGVECVNHSITDPWGFTTIAEEGNYGNFLGPVTTKNLAITAAVAAGE